MGGIFMIGWLYFVFLFRLFYILSQVNDSLFLSKSNDTIVLFQVALYNTYEHIPSFYEANLTLNEVGLETESLKGIQIIRNENGYMEGLECNEIKQVCDIPYVISVNVKY